MLRFPVKIVYPAQQTVSVWVGTFASEDDFDRAVDTFVTAKLRLPTDLESICEVSYEEGPIPIAQLLDGFSGCRSFAPAACEAAAARHISSASAALICYYVACEAAPAQWGELAFLGSFVGSDHDP